MINEDHYRKLESMMHLASIVKLTSARMEISYGQSIITLPVKPDFFRAAGALHGCMCFLALDNAAFFAVNSLVTDVFVLTVNFNIYLTRPISSGIIKAVGKVVSASKNQFIAESILHDEKNR
jgi:uncharacterized protein (TIGR00369 family)